jgi:hypothetical protein
MLSMSARAYSAASAHDPRPVGDPLLRLLRGVLRRAHPGAPLGVPFLAAVRVDDHRLPGDVAAVAIAAATSQGRSSYTKSADRLRRLGVEL